MIVLTYKESLGPATSEEVTYFETNLGKKLPVDYKTFLETIGGGWAPEPYLATVPTWPPGLVLDSVYGAQDGDSLSLSKRNDATSMYMPQSLLHFARDPGGQFFVIDLRPEADHFGKIYVRDHDHAHNEEPFLPAELFEAEDIDADERFLYHFIAPSFTAFLEMLYSDDSERPISAAVNCMRHVF